MDLLNTRIIILSVEEKTSKNGKTMFKIKGNDNHTYQLWQSKQDGTESVAFLAFNSKLNMGIGKEFDISYREEYGTYKGKTIVYRTIVNAKPIQESEGINNESNFLKPSNEDEKWKGIRDEKRNDIKWMNALNNATLIISKKIDSFTEYSLDNAKKEVNELANWYYKLEPILIKSDLSNELDKAIENIPF